MPIHEIQFAFWSRLKESDPELFNGTPQCEHYFDIRVPDIPHILIRLDIYLLQRDYEDKGVQTIALVVSPDTNREINALYDNDCEILKKDCIINRVANNISDPISEDETKWHSYIEWFSKYTKRYKDFLSSLQ